MPFYIEGEREIRKLPQVGLVWSYWTDFIPTDCLKRPNWETSNVGAGWVKFEMCILFYPIANSLPQHWKKRLLVGGVNSAEVWNVPTPRCLVGCLLTRLKCSQNNTFFWSGSFKSGKARWTRTWVAEFMVWLLSPLSNGAPSSVKLLSNAYIQGSKLLFFIHTH